VELLQFEVVLYVISSWENHRKNGGLLLEGKIDSEIIRLLETLKLRRQSGDDSVDCADDSLPPDPLGWFSD
jgi:hypothetical protein